MNKPLMRTDHSKAGLVGMVNYLDTQISVNRATLLEIGSYDGISARIFAEKFESVHCIDPWDDSIECILDYPMNLIYQDFLTVEKEMGNITHTRTTSEEYAKKSPNYDVIYIDGMHNYESVRRDIELYIDRANCFICGHDYHPKKFPGVCRAVDEFAKKKVTFPDTSWVILERI